MTVAVPARARRRGRRQAQHRTVAAPSRPIRAADVTIEPDLSNAAPVPDAGDDHRRPRHACPAGRARTTQAGDALRDLLVPDGRRGDARRRGGLTVTGRPASLGIDADLHDVGELAPAVAALCALAETPSRLRGIAHIRGHETDRLAALATELGALGADVTEHDDGLSFEPAPAARRHLPHLRRPPDGARRRRRRVRGRGRAASRTSRRRSKTFPGFADVWARAARRRMTGRYDEHDPESYERPRRRTRPRTKDRPTYDDAVPAVVVTVDRGRYTCRLGEDASRRDRDEVAAARPQGRRRRRPGAPGRRHLRGRRVAGPHRDRRRAPDRAASYRRRRRPGRAGDRRQRRPARHRHRPRRPGAAAGPGRPRPRGGVRRGHGPAALPDQGRPRGPRSRCWRATARWGCRTS